MIRLFTLMLALLLGTMNVVPVSAAGVPMAALCDHPVAGDCDCPDGCPDMTLTARGFCQSCCLAALPVHAVMAPRRAAPLLAPARAATGLMMRTLTPEPPPPRTE